ncbi:MAG: ABC transporter permease [Cyclobacteriaceae bacterium]|nr:ABC transporter permease [Cyclobacteriaceae bacterium]
MLKNYFKVAIRNILKYKLFSAINILGMSLGLTACLLIVLYVADEVSYDTFHEHANRIYQVGLHGKIGGQDIRVASTCPPMATALVADIPEVEAATRIAGYFGQPSVKYEDKSFAEEKVFFADSNFFQFFSFRLLEGDPGTALKEPNTLVVTPAIAEKYFGKESALGKILTVGTDNKTYKVTGVVEEAPSNSHFSYNILISAQSSDNLKSDIWLNNFMYTYFLLHKGVSVEQINSKFEGLVEKYIGPEIERFMGTSFKQMKEQGGQYGYFAIGLTDIHFDTETDGPIEASGNIMYVYFFGGIGLFILIIACINFMNLSTARSAGRAKEVGLRKTLGSLRSHMIYQFLSESTVYSFLAVIISLIACYLLLPYFNLLSGKQLTMHVFESPAYVAGILALVLFVGLIAGSYPAFYLTSFSPVDVLKGKIRAGMKSKGVRSFLVVFQFAISIFLIVFTAVVYQQIQYMQEKNLGIDKNNILVVKSTGRLGNIDEAFRNALSQQAGVVKTSYTNNNFPGVNSTTVFREAGSEQDHIMGIYSADLDHMDVMKFELTEGRYFSAEFPSDSTAIILNEAAIREFNFTDHPLQAEVLYNSNGDGFQKYKIIGVMKNFNFESFKNEVRPLAIILSKDARNIMVRYTGSPTQVVERVGKLWKAHAGNEPFEYEFLDDSFDELFRSEQRMGTIFSVFAGLAIFVACLGLFALAAFTAEQRTKEIGIRKTMGASTFKVMVLLSREFTVLVMIAFVPAAALGWYVSENWLQTFSYRIEINPLILVLSGVVAIAIAWITVSFQSVKAAMANPVKSLRYE